MGLKTFYNDINTSIKEIVDDNDIQLFKYVGIWNNQLQSLRVDNNWISITYPAVFIEINIRDIEQQGMRNQIWNCEVNFHVVDDFYNGENMEENTRIFEFNDKLWEHIQCRKYPMSSILVGSGQNQEFDHDNLYHYVQSFECNYEYVYPDPKISKSGIKLNVTLTGATFA